MPCAAHALATEAVTSGSHNCSSVVCKLLQAGACDVMQPGLQRHESEGSSRSWIHSWAEPGHDNWYTPSDAAKFAMKLKQQEILMLSRWLGVDVQIKSQKLYSVRLTHVAINEGRPINAFDWAPPSWFQSQGFLRSDRRSECKPEDWANTTLRCGFVSRSSGVHSVSYFERLSDSTGQAEEQAQEQVQEICRELDWCARMKVDRPLSTLHLQLSRHCAAHEKLLLNACSRLSAQPEQAQPTVQSGSDAVSSPIIVDRQCPNHPQPRDFHMSLPLTTTLRASPADGPDGCRSDSF